MIIDKNEIDSVLKTMERRKKELKRQLAQIAEDEALFRRMKRAAESGASPEELEGLELEELKFLDRAFKTIGETALELRNAKEHYEAKHEAKGLH